MFEVGRCLYGSQNYGLNGANSDKDYKVFFCPRFHDLYYCHRADKSDVPAISHRGDELSPMDVRRFGELILAGNINVTEYLFSTELHYAGPRFEEYWMAARKLYNDGYLMIVWDKWFASLEGLVKNSFDRYGVARKSMSRAYYFYMFSMKLVELDFHMTDDSWRDNYWNQYVHTMRFDENSWMPSQEELYASLDFVKNAGREKVVKLKEEKPELFNRLTEDAWALKERMFNFVREVSFNDNGTC